MSRALAELLRAAAAGARCCPTTCCARAAALQQATRVARRRRADPAAALEDAARAAVAWCLGLDRIPRAAATWQALGELPGDGYTIERGVYDGRARACPWPAHVYRPATRRAASRPSCTRPATGWRTRGSSPTCSASTPGLARAGLVVLCYDPARAGRAAARLAPARAARAAAGRLHVARRDGGRGAGGRSTCWPRDPTSTPRGSASSAPRAAASSRPSPPRSTSASPRPASAASSTPTSASCATPRYGTGWDGWVDLCNQVPRLAATAQHGRTCVGAAAPRDVTVVHAVDDPPFPIDGRARRGRGGARRSSTPCTRPAACGCVEVTGGHGLHPAMREAATAALAAALGLPAPPPERDVRPAGGGVRR